MTSRPLELSASDPAWPARFEEEAKRIRKALGKRVLQLEHLGSTAVPGLLADPVMDVGIGVASEADAEASVAPMGKLGYAYRGPDANDRAHRRFVLEREGRPVAQAHLWVLPSDGWSRQLAFRDRLRADPALAAEYGRRKLDVLVTRAGDRAAYAEAKSAFIEAVLAGRDPAR